MRSAHLLYALFVLMLIYACGQSPKSGTGDAANNYGDTSKRTGHSLHDYPPLNEEGLMNVVIEIPTGTLEKWEVNDTGAMAIEIKNGAKRKVEYLCYPGNYGMVPGTLLPESEGGDGDPIDVMILGPALERGAVVPCKLIGMLELLDGGEQDDKLIAVRENTIFSHIDGMEQLNAEFNGVSEIIEIWFANYKGRGKIEVISYRDEEIAEEILNNAIRAYQDETY